MIVNRAIEIEGANPSSNPDAEHLVLALATCVLLVSWLQAYLREKIEATVDSMGVDWGGLSRVQKAIIWRCVHYDVKRFTNEIDEGGFPDAKKLDEFQSKLLHLIRPLDFPTELSSRAPALAPGDILSNNGTNALARVAEALAGKPDFRGWLGKTYLAKSQYFNDIDNLISVRNDVAHGLGRVLVTVRDVRVYFVRVRQLVGAIDRFITEP